MHIGGVSESFFVERREQLVFAAVRVMLFAFEFDHPRTATGQVKAFEKRKRGIA